MTAPIIKHHRPWGYYELLAEESLYKVKRLVVKPGHRLSLQRHVHRAEHWYVVQGTATVSRGDNATSLGTGETIDIPEATWHRLDNAGPEPLVLIEIQIGDYLGEDDIERAADDYGRV